MPARIAFVIERCFTDTWHEHPSTHLARTRHRRVAESKAGNHIRRREAALRAVGTRSSPLYSTCNHVMVFQVS